MKLRSVYLTVASFMLVLAHSTTAWGQETMMKTFSLIEAVDLAHEDFPAVAASAAQMQAAEAAAERAEASRWPSLRVGVSGTQYQEPMIVSPIHGFVPGQTPPFDRTLLKGYGELSYSIFDAARGDLIEQARELAAAAGARLDETGQEITRRVVATYLQTLSRSEILAAHRKRIDALEAELDRVRRLKEAERASEIELLRAEAALASAEAQRVQAEADLDVSRRDLARLTGVSAERTSPERLVPLEYSGPALSGRDELVQEALRASPAMEAARRELGAAGAQVAAARGAALPRAELAGSYVEYGSAEWDFTGEWNLGVRVSVPVFAGGEISSSIGESRARQESAAENLELAELWLSGEVDRTVSAIEGARARVKSLSTAVARSEEIVRIEKLRLETGTGTQTDYLQAEANLLEVSSRLIQARHGEMVSWVELARLSGLLDREWLLQNLETEVQHNLEAVK